MNKKSYLIRDNKGRFDLWKEEAKERELSMNQLILFTMDKEIKRGKKIKNEKIEKFLERK